MINKFYLLKHRICSILPFWLSLLVTILCFWLALVSVYEWGPAWQHDYPSYHLPFIVKDLNLSRWELWPTLLPIWEGYPPLGHFIQGIIIKLTGLPNLANAISSISILLLVLATRVIVPGFSVTWMILGFLAMPLFLLNYPTGGLDIWCNTGILIQFMALSAILNGDKRLILHTIFILAVALVMYSKMNGWAITLIFSIVYAIYQWNNFYNSPKHVIVTWTLLVFALAYWPLRNWIILGSPIWPLQIPFLIKHAVDPRLFFHPAVRPDMFADSSYFTRYIISFFELSRLYTSEPLQWSYTMWAGGPQSPHQMMGGLNGGLMLGCVLYLILLLQRNIIPLKASLLLLASALVASIQPQSHEMRYSLYVPMILIYICLYYGQNAYPKILHALLLVGLIITITNPAVQRTNIFNLNHQLLATHTAIPSFWKSQENQSCEKGVSCIPNTDTNWGLADPLGIYFSGPTLNNFHVKACRPDCAMPWQHCKFEW